MWKTPFLFTTATLFYKQIPLDNQLNTVHKNWILKNKANYKLYKLWISINIGKVIGKLRQFPLSKK